MTFAATGVGELDVMIDARHLGQILPSEFFLGKELSRP
jgi:hypothetical protein